MACCLFRSSSFSSSSSRSSSTAITNVRVVDVNGYVEEFDYPVSVGHVTGRPPKHFVFTAPQLLSSAVKPLKSETLLQPGNIYFMLPSSTFQTDVSPLYLATVVKKLMAKAKSNNSSPARSPLRTANVAERVNGNGKRSWKPILDTIREMSFRRSKSDLNERIEIADQERAQV